MSWYCFGVLLAVVTAIEQECTFTASTGDYYDLSPLSSCKFVFSARLQSVYLRFFAQLFSLLPVTKGTQ